jgi:asparagine synthase (glutamine-hydrolysing)
MCGFCGVAAPEGRIPVDEPTLVRMRDSLEHRGPDDAGLHLGPGIALGSRRLSIVDLSPRGHMPMVSGDGRYVLSYNGEVYNFRELRGDLEARGVRFRSDTDTEVVLEGLALHGPAFFERLNGMFALALWDTVERTLLLARDRLGIKPLYHHTDGAGVLSFASEQKALFEAGVRPELDPDTWEELLLFRYVAGARTVYRGVERLLPGHYLTWKDGRVTTKRWWRLDERARLHQADQPRDVMGWYRRLFDDAIALRRISDVPLGVMLSGGLDSSSVAAALSLQAGRGVSSFTVGFDEAHYDERPLAATVADQYGLERHEIVVPRKGMLARLVEASWLSDEPLVHASDAHILALARHAKERVTVLLSGEGSDETLCGYVRYQPLRFPRLLGAARPLLPRIPRLPARARKLGRFLAEGGVDAMVLYNTCDALPADLDDLGLPATGRFAFREAVLDEARALYPGEPLRQAMYSDQHTFLCSLLDRNDRMTMGASIECRVPFLDYRLVERLASLPTHVLLDGRLRLGPRKAILRRALGDRLPQAIHKARKWGFGVPWDRYLREEPDLREVVETLADSEPIKSGPFDRTRLRQTVRRFLDGDARPFPLVKQLTMVAIWHRARFSGASHAKRAA